MTWDSTARAYLQTGKNRHFETLVWARVKRLDNGNPVEFGFWTGATDRSFTVEGASRSYFGAQGGIQPSAWTYEKGLEVFTHTTRLSVSPEVDEMIRDYHIADAPYEIHTGLFDPVDLSLIGFARRWQGVIDTAVINDGVIGGQSSITIRSMTKAIAGLKVLPGGKSDADQKRRNASDGFLKDASMGTAVSDPWQAKA